MKIGGEVDPSRRRFLRNGLTALGLGAVGVVDAKAAVNSRGFDLVKLAYKWEINQLAKRTGLEPFKLMELLMPFDTFSGSPTFKNNLTLPERVPGTVLFQVWGDSNARGPNGNTTLAFPSIYGQELTDEFGTQISFDYRAQDGATTARVVRDQFHIAAPNGTPPAFDEVIGWMNVGGNDLRRVASTAKQAQDLANLTHQPIDLDLFDLARKTSHNLDQFDHDCEVLFDEFGKKHVSKVDQLVVLTLPHFGRKIKSQVFDGKSYDYSLQNSLIRDFSDNVTMLLNNRLIKNVDQFAERYRNKINVVSINTSQFIQRDDFGNDQHYNEQGSKKIAGEVRRRTTVKKAA